MQKGVSGIAASIQDPQTDLLLRPQACYPSSLPRHWPSLIVQILYFGYLPIVPQILSLGSFDPTPCLPSSPPPPPPASPSPVLVALLELDHLLSLFF